MRTLLRCLNITALDAFIDECGEDMSDEWELVEEEIVDGEHQDFDFEETLNDVANEKLELASTPRTIPRKKVSLKKMKNL